MSTMKLLPAFFLSSVTTVFLAACTGPTPPVVIEPTTFDLSITVAGVPGAPVKVLNAAGETKFSDTVTGSKTLSALPKGKYTVTGGAVANFVTPVAQTADLSGSDGTANLVYTANTTADLTITVTGASSAPVKVTNAAGDVKFEGTVTGTKTFSGFKREMYTVTAGDIVNFTTPSVQTGDLSDGDTSVTLTYTALTTADLNLTVAGVFAATLKVVNDAGIVNFEGTVTGNKTINTLPRGKYTVSGSDVVNFVTPAPQMIDLSTGNGALTLTYSPVPLVNLVVMVTGTPSAPVKVVNLAGVIIFDGPVMGSKTLNALQRGRYTVTGGVVSQSVAPPVQTADLTSGDGSVTLAYSPILTAVLYLTVSGVPTAPVKVIQNGSVLFDGAVTGSLSLPELSRGPTTVTAGSVTGYDAPNSQTIDLTSGSGNAVLVYTPTLNPAQVQGQVANWIYGPGVGALLDNSHSAFGQLIQTFSIDSQGRYDFTLAAPTQAQSALLRPFPFLASNSGCTGSITSSNSQARILETDGFLKLTGSQSYAHLIGYGVQGAYDFTNGKIDVNARWYADAPVSYKGTLICPRGSISYDLSLKPGWNIVELIAAATQASADYAYTQVTSNPAPATQFVTDVQLSNRQPNLTLAYGTSTTIMAGQQTDVQMGVAFEGAVPFSPDLLNLTFQNAPTGLRLLSSVVQFAPHYGAIHFIVAADATLAPGIYTVDLVATGSGYTATSPITITVMP